MEEKELAYQIFEDNPEIAVVQIRKLADVIQIKTSTASTMAKDRAMNMATVWFRSIHFR